MIEIVGRERKRIEIEGDRSVSEIMKELGLNPEGYVPILNNMPVTGERQVRKDDHLVLQEVFSGG